MRLALLTVPLLLAGCVDIMDEAGPTPTSPSAGAPSQEAAGPTTLYDATIAFNVQTEGEEPLQPPQNARTMTLEVRWTSDTVVQSSANIRIAIEDAAGEVLSCEQGVNVLSGETTCGPKENGIDPADGPFKLVWSGSGNSKAEIRVTAA